MNRLFSVAIVSMAVSAAACASQSHRIPQHELARISQTAPETRGQRVRVVQSLGNRDDAPPAPPAESSTQVVVVAPIWVGGTPHHHHHAGGGGGGGGSSSPSDLAKAKKQSAKAWLVVAAAVAGALAFTEGTRFDGWAEVHPMHPVHLWGPRGEYTWMPLAHVTPEVAAWSQKAVIRQHEGPWRRIERAPLNRAGFTYSLLLGGGQIALEGADPEPGFMSHITLGYFPTHVVGLQLDLGMGWAEDDFGATVFDARYGLEVDVLPLSAGILHGGVYGALGFASRSDDGIQLDDRDTYLGGGVIAQLELTTRLTLSARAGLTRVHDETLSELTAGISIY